MRRGMVLGALLLVGALSVVGVSGQRGGQRNVVVEQLEDNLYVLRAAAATPRRSSRATGWCWSIRSSRAGGSRSSTRSAS